MKYFIFIVVFMLVTLTTGVYSEPGSHNQFKSEFLDLINSTRQKGCTCGITYMPPAPPVVWNDELAKAAMGHARDMEKKNYFSHTSRDGRSSLNRIENVGYNHNGYKSFSVGENIAEGQLTITEVMAGWFKSEGHCRNLMNPDFKEVGVAQYNNYWVQDFGGREAFSPEMQRMIKSGKVRIIQQAAPVSSE
jgi:uncharacterized protein YkwD